MSLFTLSLYSLLTYTHLVSVCPCEFKTRSFIIPKIAVPFPNYDRLEPELWPCNVKSKQQLYWLILHCRCSLFNLSTEYGGQFYAICRCVICAPSEMSDRPVENSGWPGNPGDYIRNYYTYIHSSHPVWDLQWIPLMPSLAKQVYF